MYRVDEIFCLKGYGEKYFDLSVQVGKCLLTYFKLRATSTRMSYPLALHVPKKVRRRGRRDSHDLRIITNLKICQKVLNRINSAILRVWELGILSRLQHKFKPMRPTCPPAERHSYKVGGGARVFFSLNGTQGIYCTVVCFGVS